MKIEGENVTRINHRIDFLTNGTLLRETFNSSLNYEEQYCRTFGIFSKEGNIIKTEYVFMGGSKFEERSKINTEVIEMPSES